LTSFGALSRNRTTGIRLAKGDALADICATSTVEGVPTAEVAVHFADMCGLELPLFRAIASVLNGTASPHEQVAEMMGRPLSHERKASAWVTKDHS